MRSFSDMLSYRSPCPDIYVVFAPKAAGLRAGTLSVTDNATSSPQRIALSGRG